MALNSLTLLTNAFADIKGSEERRMMGMAGISLMILNDTALATGVPQTEDNLRKLIASEADRLGMLKTTYQAYINGVFECTTAIARHYPDRVADLGDMTAEEAVLEVAAIYAENNVFSGGHIRAWGKQIEKEFTPYDADRVARDRREKQLADRQAAAVALRAAASARNGRDSSTLPAGGTDTGTAPLQIVDYTAEAIRCVDGITTKEALARLLEAVNLRMETFLAAERPATVPPVTADTVDDTANKARKAPRKPRAVKLADLGAVAA